MRRRRYLQAAGTSLSALFAGCSRSRPPGAAESATDTPTAAPTDTEAPTATETEEFADSPGDVEIPRYIELLPNKHLGGTERTNNANFFRIDWEWYIENRAKEMQFGAAAQEDWTLEPTEENYTNSPSYDILKGPVNAVLGVGYALKNIVSDFPNAGPEILRQCQFMNGETKEQHDIIIDEVIAYAEPGIIIFVGVDTESLRRVLKNNNPHRYEQADVIGYKGNGEFSDRLIYLSEEYNQGVVAIEAGNETSEALQPTLRRLGKDDQSVGINESVQWCLSRLAEAPVITGGINGGKQVLAGSGYSQRGINRLPEYDTLFQSFDTDGSTASVQLVTSRIDKLAPTEVDLKRIYGENKGRVSTTYHPNVSTISLDWS